MRLLTLLVVLTSIVACAERDAEPVRIDLSGDSLGFRGGPDRLGVSTGSMTTEPLEAWSFDTGNHVISSPVAFEGGTVIVGDDGLLRLVDSDGESEWMFELGEAEATPAVVGAGVVAISSDGRLVLVSASDGNLVWETQLSDSGRSSPIVVDGLVVVGAGEDLVAVEAPSGTERWRTSLGAPSGASPAIKDGHVVMGSSDNLLSGFRLVDGEKIWTYDFGSTSEDLFTVTDGVVATAALSGDLAYVGSTNGKVAAIETSSGQARWEVDLLAPVYASAAVGENVGLTTAGGRAVALDPTTGSVVWEVDLGEPSYASPLLIDDALIVTTEEGIVLGLDPESGLELWRVTVGIDDDFMASTPTFTLSGLLVLGSNDGRVVALQEN